MAIRKSRVYTQDDGSKVSFDFDGGKLVGMKKDGVSLNPESVEFVNLAYEDDALAAYNVSKYSSNKRSYEDSISISSKEERDNYYTTESKKETNEASIDQKTKKLLHLDKMRLQSLLKVRSYHILLI